VNGIHGETTGLIGGGGQYGGIHGLVKNLALRPVILGVSPVLASNDIVSFRGVRTSPRAYFDGFLGRLCSATVITLFSRIRVICVACTPMEVTNCR
jgi:hypothetical protein